ncbi:hypothetical protein JIQ42_05556 [Leishmania sp. Namibia]|uniref:hypothetical protein n=1 Tax=Leishmania sp. Namibia TaxID=2802991 RepID=UPI001B7A67AC|nr:hypothetical protein JIQ42_05556 [Leishmania sp. Namibia]
MGFDALINTLCCTCFVLFGLWIIADVVQAVQLLVVIRAYKRNEKNVFAIPFTLLLTRLFHEVAVPKFLAAEAIQRGELPAAVATHGHQTPAAVPVKYVGQGANPSLSMAAGVTSALSSSTPDEVLNKLPAKALTDRLRGRAGRAYKEGKCKRAGDGVDRENVHHRQGQQRHDSVAEATVNPTHTAADGSVLTSSSGPTWWTRRLEGQCLVLGLRLPLELLPAPSTSTQASASEKAEVCGVGGSSGTGNGPGSSNGATARQPTVNLQLKQYQLAPASLVASATASSLAFSHHKTLPCVAGRQVRVAVAQQLAVAPLHVYTRAALTRMHDNKLFVPSPLTRTPSRHLGFDAVKYAYTQHCQRLLEVAVAEQTAIAQRVRHDRKSTKRAQRIAAMLMHYLEYAHTDNDVEDAVNDRDARDGAGSSGGAGAGAGADTSQTTSGMRRAAATRRVAAERGNNTSSFPSYSKLRGGTRKGKAGGGAGVGRAELPQRSRTPWIPVLMGSVGNHTDEYDAVGRDVDFASSALSGHSLHHAAAPLPPAPSTLPQQSFLQSHSTSSPMHSSQIAAVPPQLSPAQESRRGSSKRRRRAEQMLSVADRAVEVLEGRVERVRLAQALRPRYSSLICSVRFAAEQFVVRRGVSGPPTWTPLQADAASRVVDKGMARGVESSLMLGSRGAATRVSRQSSSSSSSSLSPHRLRLHRRRRIQNRSSTSPAWLQVAAREASASAFGAQGSRSVFGPPGGLINYRGSAGNSSACASATLSSQISSSFTDGQLPADTRFFSHGLRPLSGAATLERSDTHHRNTSSILSRDRSDPLPPVLVSPSIRAYYSNFALAQPLPPNAISSAPAHAFAETVAPLVSPSTSTRSASAANAAMEFLRGSRLRENNMRADIAAGVGSRLHSTTVALAAAQAPPGDGSPHQSVIKDDFSVSAEEVLRLPRSVGATSSKHMTPLMGRVGASGEETQGLATVSASESAASRRLQPEELQPEASCSKEALQSAATTAAPPPPSISASAPPGLLPPRSTDLRVVYVIGADRATLLRSLTLDATRSFAAGTQNFLCFFTPSDERRAWRRHMEQLDRQNRAELQRLAPLDTLADASLPREQRSSNDGAIDCVCSSNAVPSQNWAEERLLSASVAASCRDVGPSSGDLRMSKQASGDGALGDIHDDVFGNFGAVSQQHRAMRLNATSFINIAGADLSTPTAASASSASAMVTVPSAHQRDDSSFSTLHSLENSVCSIREPLHAVHSGTSEASKASVVPHSESSSPPSLTTIQSLSVVRPAPSTSASPAPLAAWGDEKDACGAPTISRSLATAPTEAARPPHQTASIASDSKAGGQGILDCSAAAAAAAGGVDKHVDVVAAAAAPVVNATPPTAATTAFPNPAASASKKGAAETKKGTTVSAAAVAAVPGRAPPLPASPPPVVTDSVSAHDVRQYVSAVGVTLPEQVYLLRDAGASTLQRGLAATSHNAPMLHSRRESSVRNTGNDISAAVVQPAVGGCALHDRALPSAVLSRGVTRVLEGQVEVAELSVDVLSRQVSPFVPMKPPPLSDSDGDDSAENSVSSGSSHRADYDDTSDSHSRSSAATDGGDDNVGVREDAADARRSSPSRRRGKQPQMSKAAAAASNHHLERSPKGDAAAKRSRKAPPLPSSHSRRRLQRHLARWNRHIRRRRAAAIKAGNVPIAVGALFFTAPPTLPAALVQQQQLQLLAQLERGERARLLVPEWALNGSEIAARTPVATEDTQQEGPRASPPSLHAKQSPPPRICVTLIYTATAEQVAQALVRAAEVAAAAAAAALTNKSARYDAVGPWLHRNSAVASHRGRWCSAAAAAAGRQAQSSYDSYELVSSNAVSGLYPPTPLRQRTATAVAEASRRGRREPSSTSTALPSEENSLHYSFLSESFTSQQSREDFSIIAPDFFVSGEDLLSCQPSSVPPARHHRTMSPLSSGSATTAFCERNGMEGAGCREDSGSGNDDTAASEAAAVAADAALASVHDRPPSWLLLTESSDSVHGGREGRSGVGGSAAVAGGRWGVFGIGADAVTGGVSRTSTSVYAEGFERCSSSAAHLSHTEGAGDTVAWAGSVSVSAGGAHANEARSKSVRFKAAEAGRCEEDKFGASDELRNVLHDSACFPEGVPVGVSLTYVRIGKDLYAITEVVDRSFLQYREERVIQLHTSREEGGGRRASDGDDDSFTPLSDSGEDAREDGACSSSSLTNSSFASHTSFNTLDAALQAIRCQHEAAARHQRHRLYHRCRAISTSDFGGLSYSLAGSAPLRSGMRRQEMHMCWRCLSAEAVVIFVPCGHYAVCEGCAELLAKCCVCRTPILSSVVLLERSRSQE